VASGLNKVLALVLHRYPFSESSFIVKALTPESGVLSLLVKGARRKGSPFHIALDPLALTEIVYQPSPRRELQLPREASLLRYHDSLRKDLEKLAMAQVMTETLLRLVQEGGHYREEFELIKSLLAWLDGDNPSPESPLHKLPQAFAVAWFLHELAECMGFRFHLESCVQCQKPLAPFPADIWPALGGGVCATCLGTRHPSWNVPFRQQLYTFVQEGRATATSEPLESFMLQYLRIHTGHPLELRSWNWLQSLRIPNTQGDLSC